MINFISVFKDRSGYGQFARNCLEGLDLALAPVKITNISYENDKVSMGSQNALVDKYLNSKIDTNINLICLTPERFKTFYKPGEFNIGFTMFETTRIPDSWVKNCNEMESIFVPCKWNKEVFESSGVTVPIYVVHPGIDVQNKTVETNLLGLDSMKNKYKFYSVFQWTERKNPTGLLKGYFSAMTGNNDVVLILKTYLSNNTEKETEWLIKQINDVKKSLNLKHYPSVYLISEALTRDEMLELHAKCDCFVLPHRSEGFGMPHLEALSHGKPIITTNYGGNTDFCNGTNSYLLDYTLTPVSNMPWIPWYEGDMLWAEPNTHTLMKGLQHMYNNKVKDNPEGIKSVTELSIMAMGQYLYASTLRAAKLQGYLK